MAKAKGNETVMDTDMEQWDDSVFDVDVNVLNAELNTSSVIYLSKQKEKVQLRIVWQPSVDKQYFHQFETDYNGKPVKQVCFKAVQIVGEEQFPVMVVGKPTHVREVNRIIAAIKEDNNIRLLHPVSGTVVTFTKSGEGIKTKYHVSPTLKAIDVSEHFNNGFDTSLEAFAERMTKPKEDKANTFDIDERELFDD